MHLKDLISFKTRGTARARDLSRDDNAQPKHPGANKSALVTAVRVDSSLVSTGDVLMKIWNQHTLAIQIKPLAMTQS